MTSGLFNYLLFTIILIMVVLNMKKNKNITMSKLKNEKMKIITKNNTVILEYTFKISKRITIKKNKAKTENRFYAGYIPPEIREYLKLRENLIFFYNEGNEVRMTSRRPSVEHQQIKVQKSNNFSIPKSYFPDVEKYDFLRLTVDFGQIDRYKNGLGVITVELV